jgi:hypothetical protein
MPVTTQHSSGDKQGPAQSGEVDSQEVEALLGDGADDMEMSQA